MKKILVIIPAYNEEESIAKVIKQVKEALSNCDILVVNDGSIDQTANVAKKEQVWVLDLVNNLGIGGALQAGYKYAFRHNYEIAVQIDGDGQHNPFEIVNLIKPLQEDKYDVVIGARFIKKEGFKSTLFRRFGIQYFSVLIRLFTGATICDPTSGFRACNRAAIRFYAAHFPNDYASVESITNSFKNGLRVGEVPVIMEERANGISSINMGKAVYYMIKVSLAVVFSCLKAPKNAMRREVNYEKNTNNFSS